MEMDENKKQSGSFLDSLDMDSILRDLCRQWWVILIAAAAAALIAGTYAKLSYKPQYTATATFVISKSGVSSNTVSDSLSAASALAETFTTVVDSEILESRVCSALGLSSLDGEISVSVVESTSLMTLTINTSSPWLAYEMIQATMDAVLVDCDFRKPAQYKILNLPKEKEAENDLGSALKTRGTIHVTPSGMKKNLPVIFSTVSHKRLLNRETTESLEAIIGALLQTADYVILDTSPMGLVAESTQVAALADACLLVVEQDVVDARLINDALDQLGDTGAKVLGCVFNDVHTGFFAKAGTYGSYYGYGRSYGYGRYGYGRYGHYAYGHYDADKKSDKSVNKSTGKSADKSGFSGQDDGRTTTEEIQNEKTERRKS